MNDPSGVYRGTDEKNASEGWAQIPCSPTSLGATTGTDEASGLCVLICQSWNVTFWSVNFAVRGVVSQVEEPPHIRLSRLG